MTMTATADQNRETALRLAASGFHVFPCHAGGDKAKQPMPFIKWREASTTEEGMIRQWWSRWPGAAIGLDLGKSGLLVIDADRHGPNDGVAAMGALMDANQYDPNNAILVGTPNEGTHFFYRQPAGRLHGNARGQLPPGIDVRGNGGYVIAPGTIMQDGRNYDVHGDIAEAPELPAWLWELITSKAEKSEPTFEHASTNKLYASTKSREAGNRSDFFRQVNAAALADLSRWVPSLFPSAKYQSGTGAYRVSSKDLGRNLQEDLSIAPNGIVDFGVHDMGDPQNGNRTPIDLCIEYGAADDAKESAFWLCEKIGANPDQLGWVDGITWNPEHAEAARRLIRHHDGTITDEAGEIVEQARQPDPTPFSDYPPGLVGDIARWIVASARRPQARLSIGAALTIVGTMAGRHIMGPTEAGTALYVLGLSPTASGKDHPLKAVGRIMTACNMGHHLGPSEFISMTAIVNLIKRKPLCVAPMDEFGDFMRRVYARKGSPHERAVPKLLRTLWSANFSHVTTPEWAGLESQTINSPHLSMFGVSTHEQFYTALEGGAATDGTLNRFLIIDEPLRARERDPHLSASEVPQHIIDGLRRLFFRSGEIASALRNDPGQTGNTTRLEWGAGAEQAWRAYAREIDDQMFNEPDKADFLARGAEMSVRIATIIAAGRHSSTVDLGDIEYGIRLARDSIAMMLAGAQDYMAENENQANAQKIVRLLKEHGVMKHSMLLQRMKHTMRARDFRDLIGMMKDAEQIEYVDIESGSGPVAKGYRLCGQEGIG